MCDRVFDRFGLPGVDKGELEPGGRLVDGKETALCRDDEGLRGQLVTGLAEVDGVVRVQELLVLDVGVWRSVWEVRRQLKGGDVASVSRGLTSEDGRGRDFGGHGGEEESGGGDELLHFKVIGD